MKLKLTTLIFLSGALLLRGQGTFVWDQQASDTNSIDGVAYLNNQQPMGQAFTPSFSSISAAAFFLSGGFPGATGDVEVNIRSGSITGTILGTSDAVTFNGNSGIYDFLFSSPVTLTPGITYYLQPIQVNPGGVGVNLVNAPVPTGGAIYNGVLHNNNNYWYQEGIVVPEPSSALLAVAGVVAYLHRRHRRKTRSGDSCNENG